MILLFLLNIFVFIKNEYMLLIIGIVENKLEGVYFSGDRFLFINGRWGGGGRVVVIGESFILLGLDEE